MQPQGRDRWGSGGGAEVPVWLLLGEDLLGGGSGVRGCPGRGGAGGASGDQGRGRGCRQDLGNGVPWRWCGRGPGRPGPCAVQ